MKSRYLFAAAAILILLPVDLLQAQAPPGQVYGVIEIGSKGIKAMAVEIGPADQKSEDPPTKTLKQFEPQNKNAYAGDTAASVGTAVAELRNKMQDEFKVPADHIFLVGSSGVPPDVRRAIGNNMVDGLRPDYIDASKEATLVFKGIVPPHRYKMNEVVLLDIGSGNSKGAYLAKNRQPLEFTTFSIPWGTATFSKEINEKKKDGSLVVAAEPLRVELLLKPVQVAVRDYPGMQNCTRLYLAGGISWAMATLLHPEKIGTDQAGRESSWVELSREDVTKFCKLATTDPTTLLQPSYAGVRKENRQKAEDEVARVAKTFNQDQLMAGALILQTFMDEMHYEKKTKIFFSKRALFAWPMGYVLENARKGF